LDKVAKDQPSRIGVFYSGPQHLLPYFACWCQAVIGGDVVMKTDSELKADLMERLDAIPSVNASEVEVLVDNGMVTLNGQVDTYQTRFQVERTVRRVGGMRGLQINIKPGQAGVRKHHR
jgi:hypothetical protein